MSSIFDGIENAKPTGEGNWVRIGRYIATINGVRLTKNYKGEQFCAVEMTIASVIDDGEGQGHKVGEEVTHLMKVANPSFLGNFKAFAASALGCNADEVGKAEADRITSDEQPLAGIAIEFNARNVPTKAGGTFTKVTYLGEVEQAA